MNNILQNSTQYSPKSWWQKLLSNPIRLGGMVVFALVILTFAHRIEELSYRAYIQDQRLNAALDLSELRSFAETRIYAPVLKVNELAAVIGENPEIGQTQFSLLASEFLRSSEAVLNVALAPDQIVTMVYPRKENQAAIGFDYRTNADQYPAVQEAIRKGEITLNGPVDLVQGGRGLIVRKPVYVVSPERTLELWGIAAIVIDYESFLADIGLAKIDDKMDIVIYDAAADDPQSALLGSRDVLSKNPILLDFTFPFGEWKLAAAPDGGWPVRKPGYTKRWVVRIIAILSALVIIHFVTRLADNRRIAERQLSHGIETLDHGFVMFDPDGRLVLFNQNYKDMHAGSELIENGVSYEKIVWASIHRGRVPEAVGQEEEWFNNWMRQIKQGGANAEQTLSDGRVINTYDRLVDDGSIVGLRIDISDLKNAQHAAEAANQAKTDFMGNLSHELRTPLTVILGHAKLAQNTHMLPAARKLERLLSEDAALKSTAGPLIQDLYAQMAQMMVKLETSGTHLLNLINEILDFAKIDSGTLSIEPTCVTVDSLIEAVGDQMRPMIIGKGLGFKASGCSGMVNVDPTRIKQVLFNLVGNASKFTTSGTITLNARRVGETYEFHVTDTGIGIPAQEINRVFEAFHQVDSSATRKFGGTGLGLAISNDITKAHGGTLRASSTEGEGSTFVLTLPAADEESCTEGKTSA
ncbi:MAG: sensor histidine kinase [Sulfitobacter sp.]